MGPASVIPKGLEPSALLCVCMRVNGVPGHKCGCSRDHMHENALSCTHVICTVYCMQMILQQKK